jgi:hypothetical protein
MYAIQVGDARMRRTCAKGERRKARAFRFVHGHVAPATRRDSNEHLHALLRISKYAPKFDVELEESFEICSCYVSVLTRYAPTMSMHARLRGTGTTCGATWLGMLITME